MTTTHELVGPWKAHLTFTQGPHAGAEQPVLLTFHDDGVITHADQIPRDNGRLSRGIGEWGAEDGRLSYWFHVVLTDLAGKPASVVNIRAEGALDSDRRTFTATGTGQVYGGDGSGPLVTHQVDVRAARADGGDPAREQVMRMIQGYWLSQICGVTARLRLADHLVDGPRSVGELARVTGADSRGLARLLRGAVTAGLFVETAPDRFGLTALGAQLRDRGDAGSLRDLAIALTAPGHWLPHGRLCEAVMAGRPQAEEALGTDPWTYYAEHPDERLHFARAMSTISAEASREVVRHYDVAGCRRVVDVGGSQGMLLAGLLSAAPSARGVLFDLPGVVEGARAALAARGLGERVEIVAGDFFDAVPAGGDLYLLKSVLHDWDDEPTLRILRNVHRASQPGARLAVIERPLPAESGPSYVHLLNLLMLVELDGRERTLEAYARLLDQAGFRLERTIATSDSPDPWTVIEAIRR